MGGCRLSWPLRFSQASHYPTAEEQSKYRQAVAAYEKTAYLEAAESFEGLWSKTNDKRFAHMALYGLACSKLMAANTPDDYKVALEIWEQWVENAPKKFDYENPMMADAFIKEKMLFSNIPLSADNPGKPKVGPMVSQWLLIETKVELDRLREELNSAQEALAKRQKIIKARENKIGELRRQIKALETIDQKIQKKKDAIPSADTAIKR